MDRHGYLTALLHELYADKPQGKVHVVVESAWLPLLLADTGGGLLSAGEVQALVRHRLNACHAGPSDDLAAWDVRVDYRAGDRFSLGYGFTPHHKQAVLAAAAEAGLRLDAVTPAFLWGWKQVRSWIYGCSMSSGPAGFLKTACEIMKLAAGSGSA